MTNKKSLKSKLLFYKSLQKLKPEHLNEIIQHLNDDSVDSICECVYNTIFTDLKIPQVEKTRLKKKLKKNCSRKNLDIISSKNISISRRRKALKQEGKGIGLILSSIIPMLTSLFSK